MRDELLCFVVPCHGRRELASICLRQLRRTCDSLTAAGLPSSAVVIADDPFFAEITDELDFAFVTQANDPLGRKWNDGYEHACRDLGATYLVPIGSDDIVDWHLLADHLPEPGQVRASRLCALVSPDGERLLPLSIRYAGGDGIRTFRADSLKALDYRPAIDSRNRALDSSIVTRWIAAHGRGPQFVYHDLHPLQIVGLKSSYGQEEQLNGYAECVDHAAAAESDGALDLLAEHYPAELLLELREHYARQAVAA